MARFSTIFLLILLAALVFRIAVMFWALEYRENSDVLRYKDWVRIGYVYGFTDTYKTTYLSFGTLANNQPPGSLYILSSAYRAELLAAKGLLKITKTTPATNPWVNSYLPDIFLRAPSIIADLLLGGLIYLFIKRRTSEGNAILGASLFLFTPPVWYNSAFWGQMDSLNNMFFLIAIYFLYEHKFFLSILFCSASFFIKVSLLPALPIFFFILYFEKTKNKKLIIPMILIAVTVMFLITIPVSQLNFPWLFNFYRNNGLGEMPHITNFAFNLWWFFIKPFIAIGKPTNLYSFSQITLTHMISDSYRLAGVPLHAWAVGLFIISYIPLVITIYPHKEKILLQNGVLALTLIMVISFLILPMMHERYMYPVFPLLAVYIGLRRKYFMVFILLSVFNFINLYVVWHPMPLAVLPYRLISDRFFQWMISAGIVLVSMYFLVSGMKQFIRNEKK